jgi:hypothetical protein
MLAAPPPADDNPRPLGLIRLKDSAEGGQKPIYK